MCSSAISFKKVFNWFHGMCSALGRCVCVWHLAAMFDVRVFVCSNFPNTEQKYTFCHHLNFFVVADFFGCAKSWCAISFTLALPITPHVFSKRSERPAKRARQHRHKTLTMNLLWCLTRTTHPIFINMLMCIARAATERASEKEIERCRRGIVGGGSSVVKRGVGQMPTMANGSEPI